MSDNDQGIIVILSSPSGAGKTSLVKEISSKNNFSISISHTTRKPRKNEINGVDYFFINQDEFEKLIKKNKFLEYAQVFNHYYGSSEDIVFEKLDKGHNVIFDIDWQGTEQIKKKKLNYKLITFFILPPSRKTLYERLLNRESNNKKIAEERMSQFDKDVLHWKSYDYVVINDDFKKCYNQINLIINTILNKKKINFNTIDIEEHVKKLLQ